MLPVATYVFVDLETTGLPVEETNRTKITELSMVAVKREHLLRTLAGAAPRVQNKLTLCFNPCRMVHPGSTATTGLCNDLLEHETKFDKNAFNTINSFLNILAKPVCLVAQNGHNFDFPIIKNHLQKLSVQFTDDLLCADCLHAFYDILEKVKSSHKEDSEQNNSDVKKDNSNITEPKSNEKNFCVVDNQISMQNINETTPKQQIIKRETENKCVNTNLFTIDNQISMQNINETTPKKQRIKTDQTHNKLDRKNLSKVRRRFPWSGTKPKDSYKLKNIYERVLNRTGIEAHRAENDCIMALEISAALNKDFVKWVDENHCLFSDVKPMTIGVPLGE
ncbi:Three prime repair exonuclease 2 [Papilio machaon]|uniref:Three prime repair exonuclease 2 n=1 Tax=Papilio machaon TaxID=76193 RepID=A0A0N1IIR4_PAPMA|nr:Three prime repair exonuclease 2 [Papilio machaon]